MVPESLVASSGRKALSLIVPSNYFKAYIQFWQTWTHMEIAVFIHQNPIFPKDLQAMAASKAMQQWTDFDQTKKSGSPSIIKNANIFQNRDYWDPQNTNIIWDDRLWLANANVSLYNTFRVKKYLQAATRFYDFIVEHNWKVNNYDGVIWKHGGDYKNTITNSLFMVLSCRLYQAVRDPKYLETARAMYKYLFKQEGKFINAVAQGIFPDYCNPDGFYTYNQAVPLQGLCWMALNDQGNRGEYVQKIVDLINNTVVFFKSGNSDKLICVEFAEGDFSHLRTAAIFRCFLFRTFVYMKRILPVDVLQQVLAKTPRLKIFIMDNAQAMCKFQNLAPSYKWDVYNNGMVHQYNAFNQFYCLLAAHELYGVQEVTQDGIGFKCDGTISIQFGPNVKTSSVSKISSDFERGFVRDKNFLSIFPGNYKISDLLKQDLTKPDNNTSFLQLSVTGNDGSETMFVLVHMEAQNSKFSIIPDNLATNIASNYLIRIDSKKGQGYTYESSVGRSVSLSHVSTPSDVPLRLIVQ